jgi:hypothetical protein
MERTVCFKSLGQGGYSLNPLLRICDVVEILCKTEFTIAVLEWSIHALTKMA